MTVTVHQAADCVHQDSHYNQSSASNSINANNLRQFLLDIVAQGVTTLNGPQGAQGNQGAQGSTGATGGAGAQGAQGVAP